MRFKIEWVNGIIEEIEKSDCSTVEQYINARFGSNGCADNKVTLIVPKAPKASKTTAKDEEPSDK